MIAAGAAGLGGVALFAAAGAGLAELSPALRRIPLGPRLGYSYLLGLGAVAGALYALSHVARLPLRGPAVWIVAAVPATAGLLAALCRRLRAPAARRQPGRWTGRWRFGPGDRWVLAAFGVVALVVCGLAADAATDPVKDWDGRMTWSAQARYLRAEGTVDAEVLRHRRWFITHPQYPLLLPVAQVAVLEAFAADSDSHAFRMLYVGAFAAWLLVVYDGARRLAGRRAAALAAVLAAAAPFFEYGEGGAAAAYSDLPLAAFYGAALVLLVVLPPRPLDAWVAGILLAAMVLTKNEGLPLAGVVLALALGQAIWRRHAMPARRLRASLPALTVAGAMTLAAWALLASWRAGVPNRQDEEYLATFRWESLWPAVVTLVPRLAPTIARRLLDWRRWMAFWWTIPALLAAGWRTTVRPRHVALVLAAAAPPAIGWAAYSVQPDPVPLATVTCERFMLQGSVPLLLLVACALAAIGRRLSARSERSPREARGSAPAGRVERDRARGADSARRRDSSP